MSADSLTGMSTGSGAVDEALALWRALIDLGVRHAVVSPGSRSAPLVHAFADPEIASALTAHVRIDERAAAFTALGISRADPEHPAAVLTTSGTATAHLLAAVMEAHHSRIPLLVLTADRPAELRGTGANQTTEQVGLYRGFVRLAADVPAPTAQAATATELRTIVDLASRAVAAATGENPGPVHLNLCFRDPLAPAPGAEIASSPVAVARRAHAAHGGGFPQPVPVEAGERAVVIAGDSAGPAAADFARAARLPLIAEPSSGALDGDVLIPHGPRTVGAVMAELGHPLRPERAIVFGRPTLSRPILRQLLGADDVELVVVDPHLPWVDPTRRASLIVPAAEPVGQAPEAWARSWRDLATAGVPDTRDPGAALPWQARAALAVWEACDPEDVLVLGSSSLVRDLELHAGPSGARVIANRGLAGIDGTVSMAGGISLATGRRVRVLLGDLTALHDLTGLVIGPLEQRPQLDVIVVDDDGGRIFGGLEHAGAEAALMRRFFTTPHGVDVAAAAAGLGAAVARVGADGVASALAQVSDGVRVILVQEPSSAGAPRSREEGLE